MDHCIDWIVNHTQRDGTGASLVKNHPLLSRAIKEKVEKKGEAVMETNP